MKGCHNKTVNTIWIDNLKTALKLCFAECVFFLPSPPYPSSFFTIWGVFLVVIIYIICIIFCYWNFLLLW